MASNYFEEEEEAKVTVESKEDACSNPQHVEAEPEEMVVCECGGPDVENERPTSSTSQRRTYDRKLTGPSIAFSIITLLIFFKQMMNNTLPTSKTLQLLQTKSEEMYEALSEHNIFLDDLDNTSTCNQSVHELLDLVKQSSEHIKCMAPNLYEEIDKDHQIYLEQFGYEPNTSSSFDEEPSTSYSSDEEPNIKHKIDKHKYKKILSSYRMVLRTLKDILNSIDEARKGRLETILESSFRYLKESDTMLYRLVFDQYMDITCTFDRISYEEKHHIINTELDMVKQAEVEIENYAEHYRRLIMNTDEESNADLENRLVESEGKLQRLCRMFYVYGRVR